MPQNTLTVHFDPELELWHASVGPGEDGGIVAAAGGTALEALSALLVALHWGGYSFNGEWHPE